MVAYTLILIAALAGLSSVYAVTLVSTSDQPRSLPNSNPTCWHVNIGCILYLDTTQNVATLCKENTALIPAQNIAVSACVDRNAGTHAPL